MSTVFSPSSRILTNRKNTNVSNVMSSFYSLNSNIRMKKISYQADQINKLPIKTNPTKQKSKSPRPLTQRNSNITPRSTTNRYIKNRIFSPTSLTTTNNSFMTIKVTKNKSPNRQSDLSLSNNNEAQNTLFSSNNNNSLSKSKDNNRLKIMLPYTSLINANVNHTNQRSLPYFHFEKISPYSKLPIKIKHNDKNKSISKDKSGLKNNITPIRNRLRQVNLSKQSSKVLMNIQSVQSIHKDQTNIHSSTSKSFAFKKKPPSISISTSASRSRAAKAQSKNMIHFSPSENNFANISTLKTIAVNKTKQKEEPLFTQQIISSHTISASTNISYKDLIRNSKVPEEISRNSAFSSKTNISNNDTVSTKSNYFSKTVHSIAKITQTGFAGFNKPKINQDNIFIYSSEGNEYHFIGVCDGHGNKGHYVSNFLANALPSILRKELNERDAVLASTNNFQIHKIIENTFILANSKLSNESSLDTNFSGSTCISILFSTEKIYCANVGDSRAILGKYSKNHNKWDCFPLSRDHKPSEYDEAKRIMRFNGRIEQFKEEDGTFVGPLRVWLKTESIPGLAMTRSFGDQIASSVGVICEPEIKDFLFKEEDKFVLLASDGLWEYITNEECLEVVSHYYQHNKDSESAVRELYKRAFRAWVENDPTIDDITIILIFFS